MNAYLEHVKEDVELDESLAAYQMVHHRQVNVLTHQVVAGGQNKHLE